MLQSAVQPNNKRQSYRTVSSRSEIRLAAGLGEYFKSAVVDGATVKGYTHDFYKYPARFSPSFARATIELFSSIGDVVLDPFLGGGTTLVEARLLGRHGVGVDINTLATFIAKVKTTPLTRYDRSILAQWFEDSIPRLSTGAYVSGAQFEDKHYIKNIDCPNTWRIRKLIALALDLSTELTDNLKREFVRCSLLKSSQWALDSKQELPSTAEFKDRLRQDSGRMLDGIAQYSSAARSADSLWRPNHLMRTKIYTRSIIGIENDPSIARYLPPKLIIASPPYAGVHVLYHRWQVQGRRETPAPYWIANKLDGSGESHYTFGDRHEPGLSSYYANTLRAFSSLANICNEDTLVVQLVGFAERKWQLPLYLETMSEAGFKEYKIPDIANARDGRLWRNVPNRKWHADYHGRTSSSREVVLFHRLS